MTLARRLASSAGAGLLVALALLLGVLVGYLAWVGPSTTVCVDARCCTVHGWNGTCTRR